MTAIRPTIVCITSHAVWRSMIERYGNVFAKVVSFSDVESFERRALQLLPAAILLDDGCSEDMLNNVKRIRKHPAMKSMRIVVLCHELTHEQRTLLLSAGADDILLSTHHTPRDIMTRLQNTL